VAASITAVAAALRDAASERDGQQLLLVRRFAARVSSITCAQLLSVLQLLQGTLRCTVTVALWSKLLDRANLVSVRDLACRAAAHTRRELLQHTHRLSKACPTRPDPTPSPLRAGV
jgi:hypothetical protein